MDGVDLDRRKFLALGGGLAAVAGAKAVHNVFLGYGKNLKSQDLAATMRADLSPMPFETDVDGLSLDVGRVHAAVERDGDRVGSFRLGDHGDARALESEVEADLGLVDLSRDHEALDEGDYEFEFHSFDGFFERVEDATFRPYAVEMLRGDYVDVPADDVEEVAADPRSTRELLLGLREGFRERTRYDVPRYLAGSVEDNILRRRVDLRRHFENDVGWDSVVAGDARLFCWEYNERSAEALHSVSAFEQDVPVAAAEIGDRRHKHAFLGVVTCVWDGGLKLPTAFVDYTHSTLYGDFGLTPVMGDGLRAFDDGHRADYVRWTRRRTR
ncbi:MAG: hypothetical protein ACLFMT_06575 [Halobacteriales archaeon]